jgi:hypothetical protein
MFERIKALLVFMVALIVRLLPAPPNSSTASASPRQEL